MGLDDEIVISVRNLSKLYKVYSHPLDMLKEAVFKRMYHKEFWALRDISFDLKRGEMIGIIGRNGAGKSTLLKIITGTLSKTLGTVEVNGAISSILELGTGFHPQYTGRENIFMGGLCMGMSKKQIKQKEDWIIEFSELKDVIDQPFMTYSSGMKARLTFSTAICVNPEVLIVDEALSVGDIRFQAKCGERMREYREAGGSVLFVSHDTNSVNSYCDRALWLDHGVCVMEGESQGVTAIYTKEMFDENSKTIHNKSQSIEPLRSVEDSLQIAQNDDNTLRLDMTFEERYEYAKKKYGDPEIMAIGSGGEGMAVGGGTRSGDRSIEILDYGVLDDNGIRVTSCKPCDHYRLFVIGFVHEYCEDYSASFMLRDKNSTDIMIINSLKNPRFDPVRKGDIIYTYFDISMCLVNMKFLCSAAFGYRRDGNYVRDFIQNGRVLSVSLAESATGNSFIYMGESVNSSFQSLLLA